MNRWENDKELYSEIAGYAGDSADALFTVLHKWQSSLPSLRDSYTYRDIIEYSKTSMSYKKQWLSIAAGIAAIVIFGVVLFNRFVEKPAQKLALCKAIVGNVLVQRGGEYINLTNGMEVLQSDIIVCDKGSMAVIEIGPAILRIEQNSKVSIDSLQQTQEISLAASMDKGALYVAVQKLHKGDNISVKTKTAVASVRGTSFMLQSDSKSTRLVVLDGKVLVLPRVADIPTVGETGVSVTEGKSCVIDIHTLRTIQKAVEQKKVPLSDAIKQSISVSSADEKSMQILRTLNQNVSEHIVIDENKPLAINDLYPIVSIVPYKNDIVVTTNNGIYYCENNLIQWHQDYPIVSKPYIWDDYIIFQSKRLLACDAKSTIKWELEIEGEVISNSIIAFRNTLLIPTTQGIIYFINKNGRILHKVNCNAPIVSRPVPFGQMVCVATADGYLSAIDGILGIHIYRKYIGMIVVDGIFANYPEMYIVSPSSIQKIHLLKDEVIWEYNDSDIVAAVEHPQGIIFATSNGTLGKITGNGILQWQIHIGKDIHSTEYV
ncbi:MAG: FecR family protein, partial [Spirochaetota bacterium]